MEMKNKKVTYPTFVEDDKKYMLCKHCQVEYVVVDEDVVAVTCSHCVQRRCLSLKPIESFYSSRRVKTGRPPGWQWMNEFVDKDGNVFHKGVEAKQLKGTLPPTKITRAKVKTVKRRTREQILIDRHNEKKAALKKAVKKQKDFLNHNIDKG